MELLNNPQQSLESFQAHRPLLDILFKFCLFFPFLILVPTRVATAISPWKKKTFTSKLMDTGMARGTHYADLSHFL